MNKFIYFLILNMFIAQTISFSSGYDAGYEKGYQKGYADGELDYEPVAPMAPSPDLTEEDTYIDGFKRGVIDGYNEKMSYENDEKEYRLQELEDRASELEAENDSLRSDAENQYE